MVRVLCLDDDESDEPALNQYHSYASPPHQEEDSIEPDPNIHHRFSAALSCYPIVSQLATSLDLTSLCDLSRSCRRFRVNLLPYRKQLISLALRCENESNGKSNPPVRDGVQDWTPYGRNGGRIGRMTSGRVGACARDLVGECRRCNHVVCRNCIMKPPPLHTLRGRHRRLCRACIKADISDLSTCGTVTQPEDNESIDKESIIATRTPCTCADAVWICSTCGQSAKADDITYLRGWSWRTRYSTCGGFGAGLGEGIEGVECGRGVDCLDAMVVEKEVECDASELAAIEAEAEKARLAGHAWAGNSYTTHEMVGIGGQVKMKVTKMVVIGATVTEHEDERTNGNYLHREQAGEDRSWCSWCDRVIQAEQIYMENDTKAT